MDFFTNTIEVGAIEDLAEGIYMASGVNPPSDKPNQPDDYWDNWRCMWTGHNTGHHSVCHISATHFGIHQGGATPLVMNFTTNFPIKEVKNASGYPVTNLSDRSFTITAMNNGNPNETIGFNFEIVVDYDQLHLENEAGQPLLGAIGTHNASSYFVRVASYRFG